MVLGSALKCRGKKPTSTSDLSHSKPKMDTTTPGLLFPHLQK